ncbi:hypothetical protein BH24ACT3_BH24ACT3_05660 [soil metagenome]
MDLAPNPAQQEVLVLLGRAAADRPSFPATLRSQLRAQLEEVVAPVAGRLGDDELLVVDKHRLGLVHGCEARYLAEEQAPFVPSVPVLRGTVVHKAIELSINWRTEPVPAELVDEALAAYEHGDHWTTDFLRTCSEVERAELRSEAVEGTTKFLECFPPLKAAWRPVPEAKLRLDLAGGRVSLRGRVDLSLGRSQGTTAGKVLIDFKTGGFSPHHVEDLRFYALVETVRLGVPPRLLASYYLDGGRLHPEPVTEALLASSIRRVGDGVERMVSLRAAGVEPTKRAAPPCRWCPILADCGEGSAFLERADDLA